MTPDQVPDELAAILGQKLYDEQSEGCAAPGCQGHPGPVECRNWARDLLAAVLPAAHIVRTKIAAEQERERDQLIDQIRTIRTLQAMWAKLGDHGLPVEREVFAQVARDLAVVLRRPATDSPAFNLERHEMGPRVVEALYPLGVGVTPDMARRMLAAINWPPAARGEA